MKRVYIFIFFCIIGIELFFITHIAYTIYLNKSGHVLGESISRIHKSANQENSSSSLRFFYEPIPNTEETDATSWLTEKVQWHYTTDSLNDRKDYAVQKPERTFRIIALGDSYTFGDHVNVRDAWPEKLEDALNKEKPCPNFDSYEVINLGVRGYDIQDSVERYRIRGVKYDPDFIVWMLILNDFDEVNSLFRPTEKEYYERLESQGIMDDTDRISKAHGLARTDFINKYSDEMRLKLEKMYFMNLYEYYTGPLLVATFRDIKPVYMQHLMDWMKERDKTYLYGKLPDVVPDTSLFLKDGHPTVAGHALISDQLKQFMNKILSTTCNAPQYGNNKL